MSSCADTCRYGLNPLAHIAAKLVEIGAEHVCDHYAAAVLNSAPPECINAALGGSALDLNSCSFQLEHPQCHYHGWPTAAIAFASALSSLAVILPATMVFYRTAKKRRSE